MLHCAHGQDSIKTQGAERNERDQGRRCANARFRRAEEGIRSGGRPGRSGAFPMVEDTRPAGYGIAPSDTGQVDPVIYARWSIHHSRNATSSGVGAFFLEYADMRHLLLPFSAVLSLAAAPKRWHYRLVQGSIGPRKESYRLPGRGAVTKRSAKVAPSTRRAFSLLCVLGLHGAHLVI